MIRLAWTPHADYIKTRAGIPANLIKHSGELKTTKDKRGFWHKARFIITRIGASNTSSAGNCTGVIQTNVVCWPLGYRHSRGMGKLPKRRVPPWLPNTETK